MKELSIEEKAKLYDLAIKKAKSKINNDKEHVLYEDDVIEMFPELKESEDERIMKEIITYLSTVDDKELIPYESWIAWIEKQSEQNYTQRDIDGSYLKGIVDAKREVEKIDEQTEKMKKEIAEFIFNLKEDIKQRYEWIKCLGFDVKFSNEEKQGEQKPVDKIEPKFNVGDKIQYLKGCGNVMTIEKIENGKYIFANNMGHTTIESGNKWYLVHSVEQNPSWNKEDEKMLDEMYKFFDSQQVPYLKHDMNDYAKFIKSLKEKYK